MPSNSTEAAARGASPWLNLLVSVAVLIVVFLLIEGLASVLMSVKAARHTVYMREESHSQYDAELGWRHQRSFHAPDLYGPGAPFTTNGQGLRATEDYTPAVPAGRYRVVALGDSFTMGYGVGDAAHYPAQMQAACPTLQTVNMGQGGYGLDQNYLWYRRDGVALQAQVLLVAAIAHDFYRMAHDNFVGYPKPMLKAEQGTLRVSNVPVPQAWGTRTPLRRALTFAESLAVVRTSRALLPPSQAPAHDPFYGVVPDEVMAAAGLALDELATLSRPRGQQLVLVYLPLRDLLPLEPSREAQWMEAHARKSQLPFINLTPEFSRLSPAELASMYRPDNHYSDAGNRLVAQALLRHLQAQVPGFPACPGIAAATKP